MKRDYQRILISFTLVLFFITAFYANMATAAENVYKWRAVTHSLVGTDRYKTVASFCDMVKKASNGRLIIEPYGAGVLFPVFDSFDSVKNGVVQMGMVWSGYWASKDPTFALIGSRPGDPLTNFSEEMYLEEKVMSIKQRLYKKYGVTYLGTFDYAPPEILCSVVPIKTLADFKGKNIRTGGLGSLFFRKLGANPVSLAAPEIYTALQMRTIDAAEFTDWKENKDMGLHEVTKYVIQPCLHMGSNEDKGLIINDKAWQSLPKDLQEIVFACLDHARYQSGITNPTASTKAKKDWIAKKVQIINLSDADVKKARIMGAQTMREQAKNQDAKDYLKVYASVLDELGYKDMAKAVRGE